MVVKTTITKVKVLELKEKAVSKKQQRFFGMVRAAQKGEGAASPEVAKVAGEISRKDAKDFAKTKHKGLPEKKKVKEDYVIEKEDSPYEKASSGALKGKTRNTEAKEKEHKTSFRRKAHRNSAAMIIRAKRKAERSGKKLSDDSAADLAHKGWASSVKHHKSSMTPEQQKRRQKLADTPYKKLSKDEQDKDKVSAKAIMSVHDKQKKKKVSEEKLLEKRRTPFQSIKSRVKKGKHKLYKLDDVNTPAKKQSMQGVGGFRGVHGASRKSKAAQGKPAPVVYSYKKKVEEELTGDMKTDLEKYRVPRGPGGNPIRIGDKVRSMNSNQPLGKLKVKYGADKVREYYKKNKAVGESAVLDANKKLEGQAWRKKKQKEYAKLIAIYNHQKQLEKRGLGSPTKRKKTSESFEIDKSAHKKVQRQAKIRNLAKDNKNPNEKAAAERKLKGPKLAWEEFKKHI